ncbi:hypothetical protein L1281_002454 [Neisseria sp. HSC-16F19]|nr:hypothetical protein [Neisseria sp. HSC-16F19]
MIAEQSFQNTCYAYAFAQIHTPTQNAKGA